MGTVPAPYTPTAGDDATQARVLTWSDTANYVLGNATSGGSRRPLAVLRQSVAQAIANATDTAITFDVEDADFDNGHDNVTNNSRYTAQTTGWYDVMFVACLAVNATGQRAAYLRLTGGNVPGGVFLNATAGQVTALGGSRKVFLVAGGYVELFVWQNSTAALNTSVGTNLASMMCVEWRSN